MVQRRAGMPSPTSGETYTSQGPNPYVFLVGCMRSGTTLLQRIVDAHPCLAIVHELWWLGKWYRERIGLTPEGLVNPELFTRLMAFPKFTKKVPIGREDLEGLLRSGRPVSFASFMSGVFDWYGKSRGKPLAGDKTPENVRKIRTLHDLWPNARFVHVIRDGRDVALSVRNWKEPVKVLRRSATWEEDPVTTLALLWEWHVRLGREAGRALGPGLYYEIRYEALVARPAEECARLCAFLGVPYDDAMLRFHEGRGQDDPGLDAKDAWRPITPGLREWRAQMPVEDVERFEATAGGLLDELGYPRGCAELSPEAVRQAARLCDLFTRDARDKYRLPKGWPEARSHGAKRKSLTQPMTSPNPFVFLVGCPRSGTTLLQRLVDAHAQLAITPETHWIPRYFERRKGLTPEGWVTPKLVRKLLAYHKFPHLGIGRPELDGLLDTEGPLSYADFVSRLFDLYGKAQGKQLVGDKTPGYARHLPILHALWPRARFVHLIRDGRDVCLSAVSWKKPDTLLASLAIWAEDRVTTAALWWEWHVRLGREGGRAVGGELYREVRYEALVARPAEECARLCAFLGLSYDPAMPRYHERPPRPDQPLHPWAPVTAGLRDWRAQMPAGDVERFEAAAGGLLDELGYPRACPRPRPAARRRAAPYRDVFAQEAAGEGPLPAAWQQE